MNVGLFKIKILGISIVLIIGLGLIMVPIGSFLDWLDQSKNKWTPAQADIISSKISKGGGHFLLKVNYKYVVNGKTYKDEFKKLFTIRHEAANELHQYKAGTKINVIYAGSNPECNHIAVQSEKAPSVLTGLILVLLNGLSMIAGLIITYCSLYTIWHLRD